MIDRAAFHLPLTGAQNLRDLGGYPAAQGATMPGRLYRADGLHKLTPQDCAALRAAGIRLVIDLRSDRELLRHPDPFTPGGEPDYVNIPLFAALSPLDMMVEGARFVMADRYCDALDSCAPAFVKVLRAIAAAPPGGVLFHCMAGKDRTGLIAALLLEIAGVARDVILADYALTAQLAAGLLAEFRAAELARGRLAPAMIDEFIGCAPAALDKALGHLDSRAGGVLPWLIRSGVSPEEIARLRDRLLSPAS